MKKRLLPLILALLMTSSSFTMFSCGENDVNSDTEAENESVPSAEDTTDAGDEPESDVFDPTAARMAVDDELPEKDFGGRTFRVMTNSTFAGYDYSTEIWAENIIGDACNDAVYERNKTIEDRFKIVIECDDTGSPHDQIGTYVTSGLNDYQLYAFQNWYVNVPITNGYLYNWCEMPYVDLDKPWHNSLANDGATINNTLYGICSDVSLSSMTYTHAIFVNTKLLADFGYNLEDIYTTVKEGKWTFDTFSNMVENMWTDSNGDGLHDHTDVHGFGYDIRNPGDVWFTALGGKFYNFNNDTGEIELTYMDDKTVTMFNTLFDFHYLNQGYLQYTTQYSEEIYFKSENLVMAPMRFHAAFNAIRDMQSAYTMIPYPKWDEAQDKYYTNADDKWAVYGVPVSVADDSEFISIIYEALAAESYKRVYPVYYDTALKGRYSSDPTTSEMVDLIMDGRAFDFSFEFSDVFSRLPYLFRDLLVDENNNIASKYRSIAKTVPKAIERVIYKAYGLTD